MFFADCQVLIKSCPRHAPGGQKRDPCPRALATFIHEPSSIIERRRRVPYAFVSIPCLLVLIFNSRHFGIIYTHALRVSAVSLGSIDCSWYGRMQESQPILLSFEICLTLPWTFTMPIAILSSSTWFIINRRFISRIKSQTRRNTRRRFAVTILWKECRYGLPRSMSQIPWLFMFCSIIYLSFNISLSIFLYTNTWNLDSLKHTFWLS